MIRDYLLFRLVLTDFLSPLYFPPLTDKLKECGFVVYRNSKLFQSKTFTAQSTFSQRIVSSKASENEMDSGISVDMVFKPEVRFPLKFLILK